MTKASKRREESLRARFREYGCDERFALLEVVDGTTVKLECRECGNVFTRHTAFLNPSKGHNIECEACGVHADGSRTPPRSEVKRSIDESEVAAYYDSGFSIGQTAAKFDMNPRRVSRIVNEAGVRRSPETDPDEQRLSIQRARSLKTAYSQPKQKRRRTIKKRFEQLGCSSYFEIAGITNRTHIVIRCLECGREFKRTTVFLDNEKADSNIGCPGCGVHVDGTYSVVGEYKKDVDENALVEYYTSGFSVRQVAEKFGIPYTRVNVILDANGIARRNTKVTKRETPEYPHEITGDPFLDEEFICAECGRRFTRHDYMVFSGRKTMLVKEPDYCSRKCSSKAGDKLRRAIGNGDSIRRARKNRTMKRRIPLGDLMERDGAVCQICGESVDLNDIYYDDNGHAYIGSKYPTMDHIVPIADGGETDWDNVQLACFRCNNKKHTMSMDEYVARSKLPQ